MKTYLFYMIECRLSKRILVLFLLFCGFSANAQNWLLTGNSGINAGNFIGSTNNASLRFITNNTQRLLIDSVGNVGIGTSAPGGNIGSKFTVRSNTANYSGNSIAYGVVVNRINSDVGTIVLGADTLNRGVFATNNANLIFGYNVSTAFTPTAFLGGAMDGFAGRFGLGTQTPAYLFTAFDSVNSATAFNIGIQNNRNGTSAVSGIIFQNNLTGADSKYNASIGYTSSTNSLGTNALRITNSSYHGNVIIGDSALANILSVNYNATVGIGDTTSSNNDAVLRVASTSKGVLIPRLTTTQVNAITSPEKGLIVYDSSVSSFKYYDGNTWNSLSAVSSDSISWKLSGNSTITAANFIGTTNNASLRFKTNNVQHLVLDSMGLVSVSGGTLSGSSATNNFFNVTGTLPASPAVSTSGAYFGITSAGSSSSVAQTALNIDLMAGFTGSASTGSANFSNEAIGTGATYSITGNDFRPAGNRSVIGTVSATTTGINSGGNFFAHGGNVNYGCWAAATTAKNSASNIGGAFFGYNSGTSSTQIGIIASLQGASTTAPVLTSAAIIADNGSTASPVFLGRINGTTQVKIDSIGNLLVNNKIIIGAVDSANTNGYSLAVNGNAIFNKVKVKPYSTWPDYVFDNNYALPSLSDVENYIKQNKHLPDMPSADEMKKQGIDLGENQTVLVKKMEELTLYIIDQNKKLEDQDKKIKELEDQNQQLLEMQKQIDDLKKLIQKNS